MLTGRQGNTPATGASRAGGRRSGRADSPVSRGVACGVGALAARGVVASGARAAHLRQCLPTGPAKPSGFGTGPVWPVTGRYRWNSKLNSKTLGPSVRTGIPTGLAVIPVI